jgi:hypothetical protein
MTIYNIRNSGWRAALFAWAGRPAHGWPISNVRRLFGPPRSTHGGYGHEWMIAATCGQASLVACGKGGHVIKQGWSPLPPRLRILHQLWFCRPDKSFVAFSPLFGLEYLDLSVDFLVGPNQTVPEFLASWSLWWITRSTIVKKTNSINHAIYIFLNYTVYHC